MKFMILVKSDAQAEAGVLPDQKTLTEIGDYNEELIKAGVMLAGEGLQPSSKGTRVRVSGGKTTVIDGPFSETKELVGGYWLIQAKDKAEAIEWVKRVPLTTGELEIRPLYEPEDFPLDPAEKPDGWRAQEEQARAAGAPPRKPGTTRFMSMLFADKNTEAGAPPNEQLLTEMGALMQELVQSGAMLSGDGLQPSSKGARVKFSGSQRTVVDGPFTETKELIAGFCVMQFATKQEAVDFTRRMLEIHVRGTGIDAGLGEVRQIFELEDFPVDASEKPDGWRAQERRQRQQLGQ